MTLIEEVYMNTGSRCSDGKEPQVQHQGKPCANGTPSSVKTENIEEVPRERIRYTSNHKPQKFVILYSAAGRAQGFLSLKEHPCFSMYITHPFTLCDCARQYVSPAQGKSNICILNSYVRIDLVCYSPQKSIKIIGN